MSDSLQETPDLERIERESASWILRCDRGLNAAEQDELFQWLAADPRHGAQLAHHRREWKQLDQLVEWRPEHGASPNPDLLAPAPPKAFRPRLIWGGALIAMAATVAVLLALLRSEPTASNSSPAGELASSSNARQTLPDGSLIELNRGAVVTVHYTASERRVRLDHGEAHFTVEKDAARPFIVSVRGIDVRAVGTAFNVCLDATDLTVLVTEGRVSVGAGFALESPAPSGSRGRELNRENPGTPAASIASSSVTLETNQRAVVPLAPAGGPARIATLTPAEIQRLLAWQARLMNFKDTPLSTIVAEFNRRNSVQLVVIDPELASVRISASFRSDNIDGFLRLLEAGFGARVERRGESEIVLRNASRVP